MKRFVCFLVALVTVFSFASCQKNVPEVKEDVINNYNTDDTDSVKEPESLPLESKTIVCMGDSLFGMHRDSSSSVQHIANVTGAKTYNVGFGGTRFSYHPYEGYDAFSAFRLVDAIVSGDWSMQDTQAPLGEDYFPSQLELLKSIDFSTVDILVLHYGTNDFNGKYVPFENPENPSDTTTILGAMNYCFAKLKTAYPELKIAVSLPVYRIWLDENGNSTYSEERTDAFGNTLSDLIEAMKSCAALHSAVAIDSYQALGIDKTNAIKYMMIDGVHFNEEGRKMFGEYIGQCLNGAFSEQ